MHSVQDYRLGERLVHAVAGISYAYLLLTGLAFWTPALYWIAIALGGGFLTRVLHPWVGLVFAAAVVWMFVVWQRVMRVTDDDRAWRRAIGSYVRNEDARMPATGRFNYGQKMLFWLMVWGGAALLVSGVVMWFVASVPWELRALRSVATFVHACAALATIGGFIVHVYMGVAVVPGGLRAVIHGSAAPTRVTPTGVRPGSECEYGTTQGFGTNGSQELHRLGPANRAGASPRRRAPVGY